MVITREHLTQEIERLNDEQLKEIADFIAFIKFKARYYALPVVESQLSGLYGEFAEEDRQMAEAGIAEYTDMLRKEDSL